jgi:hypothetical protein
LPQFADRRGRLTALCCGLVVAQGVLSFGYEMTSPEVTAALLLGFIGILTLCARLIEPGRS